MRCLSVPLLTLTVLFGFGCDSEPEDPSAPPVGEGNAGKSDDAESGEADPAEHSCYVTGGRWIDPRSPNPYCLCMDGSEPEDGWCTDIQRACEDTGGEWNRRGLRRLLLQVC